MKLKIKQSELYTYQQEAKEMMNSLEFLYNNMLSPVYKGASVWVKIKTEIYHLFKWPSSLRMYNYGETINTNQHAATCAVLYREAWHSYYSVVNDTLRGDNSEEEITLNEWTTELVMDIRKWKDEHEECKLHNKKNDMKNTNEQDEELSIPSLTQDQIKWIVSELSSPFKSSWGDEDMKEGVLEVLKKLSVD